MCFRVSRKMPNENWLIEFKVEEKDESVHELDLMPSYNIAPGARVPAVFHNPASDRLTLGVFKWGLVPHWATDLSIGQKLANARSETLLEKPSFRDAYREKRCLFIADGFYEWITDKDTGKKLPYHVRLKTDKPFAFAGLYAERVCPEKNERLLTCTIITTEPNSLMAQIHNRMPVILPPDTYSQWLAPGFTPALQSLLKPFPPELMEAYRVSTFVNKAGNDSPECIAPLKEEGLF